MSLESELIKSERDMWEGGPEAYREHLDDECLVAFTDQAAVMKREDIAKMAEAGRWRNVHLTAKGLVRPAEDAAFITYDCEATKNDGTPYKARVGSSYVKRDGEWKLAFHQQTPLN